ncbi:hypothetical protein [Clostridium perfringens]|uniref:hypothetical protein n=1 Tax=Clostridium perfringens TaxID=1502 RepID=UPI0030D52264
MLGIIYNYCKMLGEVFGFGAFEGAVIYTGIISYGFLRALGGNKEKKIIMARSK